MNNKQVKKSTCDTVYYWYNDGIYLLIVKEDNRS